MADNFVNTFSRQLRELSVTRSEKSALMEMKSLVMNNEKQVLSEIIKRCSINPIFDCLNTADDEQIELSCTIIYNLLKNLDTNECLSKYSKLMQRALSHPSARIKTTLIMLLNDLINHENVEKIALEYPTLLLNAAECLGSPERSVAQGAITLFSNMGTSCEGLRILYSSMLLEKFREVMLMSDIARFRIYEIVSNVSQKSEDGLEASQASGLLNLLLSEVKSSDTLLQLNALEILSSLGSCAHGYKFLKESGVIQYLIDKILNLEDEPLQFVLLPGLIEFFGNICKEDPQEFINLHPEVMNLLFTSLDSNDEVLLGVIFSTVGKIGSTRSGKLALNNQQNQMESLFKKSRELLSSKNDVTVSVLHSLTELLTVSAYDDNISQVLLSWFQYMGPDSLDTVVSLTKLPFIELRLSALSFLNAIAKQPWGAERLCQYAGMAEYLADRSTEFDKDCKTVKYEIVCNICASPNVSNWLSEDMLTRLNNFVKEGPLYVPTLSPEMMTEGAS